ncbi:rubrerythrin-like domain-containing protein [Halomarina pelagica]|nr:rubrerythrin-like domain-containing protein [Halomarina sp. BND7]
MPYYECTDCGERVVSLHGGVCPVCGSALQNISVGRE